MFLPQSSNAHNLFSVLAALAKWGIGTRGTCKVDAETSLSEVVVSGEVAEVVSGCTGEVGHVGVLAYRLGCESRRSTCDRGRSDSAVMPGALVFSRVAGLGRTN